MKRGLLLINLGTPSGAEIDKVRSFFREFLTDKRVIDLPAFFRYLLVYGFILPFKAKSSAKAYQSIWTEQGSPLLVYSQRFIQALQQEAGEECKISLGMRYGKPSIKDALDALDECDSVSILPLYPHYSSAATGSAIEEVMRVLSAREWIPSIHIVSHFYKEPSFIKATAHRIKPYLDNSDFLLFSYHGIPERHLKVVCKTKCHAPCKNDHWHNKQCYKAQCHQTSHLLATALQLPQHQYSTAFQSRLGKMPWIKPYTDEELPRLAALGIKNLSISCPSFVTDCLETLEEISIRAKKQWLSLGGNELYLIPSLNDDPVWIRTVLEIASV